MAKHILLAFGNPLEGREEDFNHWYNEIHLKDILKLPGFVSAQRFQLSPAQAMAHPYKYLAVYEIETEDQEVALNLLAPTSPQELPVTDAWDYDRCATWWYSSITDRKVKNS